MASNKSDCHAVQLSAVQRQLNKMDNIPQGDVDSVLLGLNILIWSPTRCKTLAYAIKSILLKKSCESQVMVENNTPALSRVLLANKKSYKEFSFAVIIYPEGENCIKNALNIKETIGLMFDAALLVGALGPKQVFLVRRDNQISDFPIALPEVEIIHGRCEEANAKSIVENLEQLYIETKAFHRPRFAAAICYQADTDTVRYLLVKTTENRRLFPKGKILSGEQSQLAALRYAQVEGGIGGRIDIREGKLFNHLKESSGSDQRTIAHLVRYTGNMELREKREPEWFTYDSALAALSSGRNARYADELGSLLRWAHREIQNITPPQHSLVGALPFRFSANGKLEMLLITSNDSGNWLMPKGHLMPSEEPTQAAEREALEEAGVIGELRVSPVGSYSYRRKSTEYVVDIYPLLVRQEIDGWQEAKHRTRKWFDQRTAADLVNERGLMRLILNFTP